MNNKRKATWDRLKQQMTAKRTKPDATRKTKGSSAPHEIIVQRLASEPDNKQTFRPVQPREFVEFPYKELTIANLKKACATHFALPSTICDCARVKQGTFCYKCKANSPHKTFTHDVLIFLNIGYRDTDIVMPISLGVSGAFCYRTRRQHNQY